MSRRLFLDDLAGWKSGSPFPLATSGGPEPAGEAGLGPYELYAKLANAPGSRVQEGLLRAASSAAPRAPWYRYCLARVLAADGRYPEAVKAFQAGLALAPGTGLIVFRQNRTLPNDAPIGYFIAAAIAAFESSSVPNVA